MRTRVLPIVGLLFSVVAVLVAYRLADGYIDRLPNHEGYYLVPVANSVDVGPEVSPRRTILIVVDGLGYQSALGMRVTERMARTGQCRATSTGELTISRPVYTIISTGLEAARTGSRNNDETSPVAVESIWGIAHDAGLRVHAASDLLWWAQLFPGVFDSYLHEPDTDINLFDKLELGDLSLFHPSRVDTAGHGFGAASTQYQEAVALVDQEVESFMSTLNLEQDLLIFSADHGHSATGGHGGPGKQLSRVLTCFAGPGIAHALVEAPIDARIIAPTLSVLLGLPFPKHMRAVEDPLDQIWTVVDAAALGQVYTEQRRAHVEQFRQANREQLGRWLGQASGTWSELYERGHKGHRNSWLAFGALVALLVALSFRFRGYDVQRSLATLVWMACVLASVSLLYTWWRGSFDFTSINKREEFLHASFSVCLSMGALGIVAHGLVWRDLRATLADQLTLLALVLAAGLAHLVIYGAPLGFPLPGRVAIFLPFLHGPLVVSLGLMAGLVCLISLAVQFQRSLDTEGAQPSGP